MSNILIDTKVGLPKMRKMTSKVFVEIFKMTSQSQNLEIDPICIDYHRFPHRNKEDDDNEQETSEMKFEEFALKTNVLAFASRSKAKAKPRKTYFC